MLSFPSSTSLHLLLLLSPAGSGVRVPNLSKRWRSSLGMGKVGIPEEGQRDNQQIAGAMEMVKDLGSPDLPHLL